MTQAAAGTPGAGIGVQDIRELTVLPGTDKTGEPERFEALHLAPGQMYAVVGNTGSGKSRLIKDVEQLVDGTSATHRRVMVNGALVERSQRRRAERNLIAHLNQSMRFVLDATVGEFVALHAGCRSSRASVGEVVELANLITPEAVDERMGLGQLSGGQTRALMIADVALVCNSPVVLVDEIENAGINKAMALRVLCNASKLVLVVTHDPHTALMASTRIVMEGGAVAAVRTRSAAEEALFDELGAMHERQMILQERVRKGEALV